METIDAGPPIQVELPPVLGHHYQLLAARSGLPVQELVAKVLTEQIESEEAFAAMVARSRMGDRARYEAILDRVPDCEPLPGDELPGPRVDHATDNLGVAPE